MARPTKYTKTIVKKARAFVDNFIPTLTEAIPMVAGLAKHLNLSRDTIYDWAKDPKKPEFSDIVGDLMRNQELMLMSGGLNGNYQPTMAKLALTKHGYTDKVESKDTTDDIDSWSDEKLDAYIADRNA